MPVAGFSGTVTFSYAITDSIHTSDPATVTLFILKDNIITVDDVYTVNYGQGLQVGTGNGFLANDLTESGQGTSSQLLTNNAVSLLTGPSHGTIQIAQDGSFVYEGDTGFTGTDTFVYRVTDSSGSYQDATVTILVVSNAPTAQVDGLAV